MYIDVGWSWNLAIDWPESKFWQNYLEAALCFSMRCCFVTSKGLIQGCLSQPLALVIACSSNFTLGRLWHLCNLTLTDMTHVTIFQNISTSPVCNYIEKYCEMFATSLSTVWLVWLPGAYGITEKEFVVVFLVKSEPKPCLDKSPAGPAGSASSEIHKQPLQPAVTSASETSASGSRPEAVFRSGPQWEATFHSPFWRISMIFHSHYMLFVFFFLAVCYTR